MQGDHVSVAMPPLEKLSRRRLQEMRSAGRRVIACERTLRAEGSNVVAELLIGQGPFYEWDHYPAGDVFDWSTGAQYYYHSHPPERRGSPRFAEHGHFHAFVRPPNSDGVVSQDAEAVHLVGVSMDNEGCPIRLFTTNRWVTGGAWREAATTSGLLRRFNFREGLPTPIVNEWMASILTFYAPLIDALLEKRDHRLAEIAARHPSVDIMEYRGAEVLSAAPVDVAAYLAAVEQVLSPLAAE